MSVKYSPEGDNKRAERPKMAIPRWRRPRGYDTYSHGSVEKRRVAHACEPCREKKTKCDGDRPRCLHCQVSGTQCCYGDGKRERAKKNLQSLEQRIADLESMIENIEPYLDSAGKLAFQKMLKQEPFSSYTNSPRRMSTSSPNIGVSGNDFFPPLSSETYAGESLISAEVGSTGSLDHITEDVNTSSITHHSGYLGKPSEVAMMNRVSAELEKAELHARAGVPGLSPSQEAADSTPSTEGMGSFERRRRTSLDDLDISILGRQVDMFGLPSKAIADKLVNSYFTTVHPLFPIICKPIFMTQYDACYASDVFQNGENSRKWLTTLNLVFAIGETHIKSQMGSAEDERKDVDYFIKSRVLGALDGGSVFEIPDLGQVQALGLTGMYLLASVQTNRAWNVVGLAIRLAHGIGLHLRNDSLADEMQKRMRLRVWYCLCCLETNLCLITGRPCAIRDQNCSAPCPTTLNDEILPSEYKDDSTLDSYFLKHHQLTTISAEVLNLLYSVQTPKNQSWSHIQGAIRDLSIALESWKTSLPFALNFEIDQADCIFRRQRLNLAFQYYNILMLINRPCLCPMDGRIPNESPESRDFNKISAARCVTAARAIIHLIVDEPNLNKLVKDAPWWCLLHYLMPAKAIIMLEMVYQSIHTPEHRAALFDDGKRILDWLKCVSKMNLSLRRYSSELAEQLKKVAPRIEEYFEEDESDYTGLPSIVDHPSLPLQHEGGIGGESSFEIVERPQHNLRRNPDQTPTWWPSAHSDKDLIMADASRISMDPYGLLLSHPHPQVDINLWLE